VLEREQAPAGVEADSDGIEAKLRRARPVDPALSKPLTGHRPNLTLLAHPDGREWPEHVLSWRSAPDDPRLHLAEHEKPRIPSDDVELSIASPKVPLDHLKAPRLEMPGSQLLTMSTEPAAGILAHVGEGTARTLTAEPVV
jgi:hypothetical protein